LTFMMEDAHNVYRATRLQSVAKYGGDHALPRVLGRAERDRPADVEATKSSPSGNVLPRST
jgi:hypothetical protein